MVYEHIGNNQYNQFRIYGFLLTSTVGYGDDDTLTDLFGHICRYPWTSCETLGIYESSNFSSYPDSLVWRLLDTTPQYYAYGIFTDFDQDGKTNLITNCGLSRYIALYESEGNNNYIRKFLYHFPASGPVEMAVDDFDGDGLKEMVCGDADSRVYVFENTTIGIDSFQLAWTYQLPPFGCIFLTAKGNDMDQDGNPEFVVSAQVTDRSIFAMFESDGNDSYKKVWQKIYYYPPGLMTMGDVSCGDIDGDGIDEMVTLSHLELNVWKCVCPDSFVSIWDRSFMYDLTDGVLLVHDLNQNGLGEVVVSGLNWQNTPVAETYLYEKMPSVTWIYPAQYDTLWANDTVNLLWKLDETVSLESLRIYIAHPLMGCWLIHQGLPTDTTCVFVVPDTQSNMAFKFWVAVQGYLRYDSIVSPPFYIKRQTGIERNIGSAFRIPHLEVYPNPFKDKLDIRYQIRDNRSSVNIKIYDVTGRLLRQWDYQSATHHGGIRLSDQIVWDGTDDLGHRLPPGVYFVKLEAEEFRKTEKVILLR